MPGLIPLVLQPAATGNRSSVSTFGATSTMHSKPTGAMHARHSSTSSVPSFGFQGSPPPKSRAMKHISQPVPPSLPVLPYTPAEWKRTMAEIKRQHLAKRFRACSTRCIEILEHIKDTSTVEPVHLIYLNFYAANSLEMCARPFQSTSPARTQLLGQARKHYDLAAALIHDAELSVSYKTRSGSSASGGSLHSPSGSVSSGTWSTPTTATSPTTSISSFDDFAAKQRPQSPARTPRKPKKTVSFSLPKEEVFKFPEPYIRPDSPTLGWEDAYFVAPITRKELPELPKAAEIVPLTASEADEHDELHRTHSPFGECVGLGSPFHVSRSLNRYYETLATLKGQLAAHSSSLDVLLEEEPARLPKSERVAPTPAATSEDMRVIERRARIERLRQTGWQRKRFDASRYEELCNNVMAELA